jgi:polysaccharide export outer membrane protein
MTNPTMNRYRYPPLIGLALVAFFGIFLLTGCMRIAYPPASTVSALPDYTYRIGPGDSLTIFVWRNPELGTTVSVRPDGKITVPLVEDMPASGKTPSQLARDIEKELAVYVREPIVTVIVAGGVGPYDQQVRVLGEAAKPQTLSYKQNMTLLDVMIQVGGLTQYAAGNQASIVRFVDGKQRQLGVRLDDLIKSGDISANVQMFPGDILIIPESWF